MDIIILYKTYIFILTFAPSYSNSEECCSACLAMIVFVRTSLFAFFEAEVFH